MASISRGKDGTALYVSGRDGKRRPIRLGKINDRRLQQIKAHVDELEFAHRNGTALPTESRKWLMAIDDRLHQRVAKVGLAAPRLETTLGMFLADYIAKHRKGVKPATVTTWRQCERLLLEHFPADTPLRSINDGHAVQWRAFLIGRGLAEATVRRRCGCAKTIFGQAVRLGVIETNPFDCKAVPTTSPRSAQKQFVDAALAERIMAELPDAQWRLLFALARWGGLRVGSEPRALTWADVDWDGRRINVPSPKTEHHVGRESRMIPMFPELAGPLQEVFDAAPEG